ncbi:MAG: hypothetical protein ACXACG_04865 [Candidatus Thorarchaeota archaeon]|jgi:hypothetical protein
MMKLSLKEKYIRAASSYKDKKGSEEVTTLIHRTPWVRILVDQDQPESDAISIEVELSIPEIPRTGESDSSDIIDQLSDHLQYLQKLREFGFELSVIGTGCIYCASKVLHETPKDNLFRALLPP